MVAQAIRHGLAVLLLLAVVPRPGATDADLAGLLERPGQAVEVAAGASRAVVSYDSVANGDKGDLIVIALVVSGPVFGQEVARAKVSMVDGQRHGISLHSRDSTDRIVLLRRGSHILIGAERARVVPYSLSLDGLDRNG